MRLRIETKAGVVVRDAAGDEPRSPARSSSSGTVCCPQGTRAYGGTYVAHVFVTSAVGASDLAVPFAYRR